jgi:hypothetical protein
MLPRRAQRASPQIVKGQMLTMALPMSHKVVSIVMTIVRAIEKSSLRSEFCIGRIQRSGTAGKPTIRSNPGFGGHWLALLQRNGVDSALESRLQQRVPRIWGSDMRGMKGQAVKGCEPSSSTLHRNFPRPALAQGFGSRRDVVGATMAEEKGSKSRLFAMFRPPFSRYARFPPRCATPQNRDRSGCFAQLVPSPLQPGLIATARRPGRITVLAAAAPDL